MFLGPWVTRSLSFTYSWGSVFTQNTNSLSFFLLHNVSLLRVSLLQSLRLSLNLHYFTHFSVTSQVTGVVTSQRGKSCKRKYIKWTICFTRTHEKLTMASKGMSRSVYRLRVTYQQVANSFLVWFLISVSTDYHLIVRKVGSILWTPLTSGSPKSSCHRTWWSLTSESPVWHLPVTGT